MWNVKAYILEPLGKAESTSQLPKTKMKNELPEQLGGI